MLDQVKSLWRRFATHEMLLERVGSLGEELTVLWLALNQVDSSIGMGIAAGGDEAKAKSSVFNDLPDSEFVAFALTSEALLQANQLHLLKFGPYAVLAEISAWGVERWCKARQVLTGREVVLKTFYGGASETEKSVARFLEEVALLTQISHPNLVEIDGGGWEPKNKHYYVAEECREGTNLWDWTTNRIRNQWKLDLHEACDDVIQAARGLGCLHEFDFVHQDVQPANLMRTSGGVVKVQNFGLNRIQNEQSINRTKMVEIGATFASPEQFQESHVDRRSDIYSLGCVLYYLCSGLLMYPDGASLAKQAGGHVSLPAPKLKTACPQISSGLEAVFQKMVAKKPEDRFQSMNEVVEALENWSSGTLVGAKNLEKRFRTVRELASNLES